MDGVTIEEVNGRSGTVLYQIEQDLKAGKYRPRPVRRVYIPKPDADKADRNSLCERPVVQQACKIVIEPVFEANFQTTRMGSVPNGVHSKR